MDYLMYVEHNAEYLQFFMWYVDYIQRWADLSPEEKGMAPTWYPDGKTAHTRDPSRRSASATVHS